MPPPGIPDWLFPSVYVVARAGESRVWVDSIRCYRQSAEMVNTTGLRFMVGVRVRDLRWDSYASLWRVSRDSRHLSLEEFLERYSAPLPEYYTLNPVLESDPSDDRYPEEVLREAPPAEPQVEVARASFQVRWTHGNEPEPEPEPDRLQLLMLYMIFCELDVNRSNCRLAPSQKTQLLSLVQRVAGKLGIVAPAVGDDPFGVYREALDALGKLLLPQEPEGGPRTRFEREPLV
jgi:hypothetical protein